MTNQRGGSAPSRPPVGAVLVVIPCYNEDGRLDAAQVDVLLSDNRIRVLFVDDGSVDGTRAVLDAIRARHAERVAIRTLPFNQGKAVAVRIGLLDGIDSPADVVGYLDADFATPAGEFIRLVDVLSAAPRVEAVLGSRVAMLGTRIDRKPTRHYLGRFFATAASLALGWTVYDTQCGAKLFRSSERLEDALQKPFTTRWAFDVELLQRLGGPGYSSEPVTAAQMREVPLEEWRDVGGSKVTITAAARMTIDLARVWRDRLIDARSADNGARTADTAAPR